jgi:hypothetical protein
MRAPVCPTRVGVVIRSGRNACCRLGNGELVAATGYTNPLLNRNKKGGPDYGYSRFHPQATTGGLLTRGSWGLFR